MSVKLVDLMKCRLRLIIYLALLQVILLSLLAFLPLLGVPKKIFLLIVLVAFFRVFGNLAGTIWGSLVSDYLQENERGRYLGWRNRITTMAGMVAMLFSGLILYFLKPISATLGFTIIIGIIAIARLISVFFLMQMEKMPTKKKKNSDFSFIQFLKAYKRSNFVPFAFYVSLITFSTHLAAPYFSVYMLEVLKMNYLTYTGLHLVAVIGGIVAYPLWGHHADFVGNAKVLKLTGFLVPFFPFLWILSKNIPFLICLEFIAGFVWAGFNLCSVNFIFDSVTPEKRVRCISYVSFMNGFAIFLGAFLGGYLVERIPSVLGSRFYSLFLLSSVLRLLAHLLFFKRFKETRKETEELSNMNLFFSVIGVRNFSGRNKQLLSSPFSKENNS